MENNINKNVEQWKKVFYTISFGQAFSIIGSSIVQFAIMWYLTVKTNSAIQLSISAVVGLLPQAILGPFIGTVVDKYKRKNIMMISDSMIALATLILAISFISGINSINLIYFVLFIRSIGSSFHSYSMQASIPMIVPQDKLGLSTSVTQFIQSGSNIVGPALGALMLGYFDIGYILLIDIIGAIIAVITLMLVNIPNPIKSGEDIENSGIFQEIKYGYKELRKHRGLFELTIIMSVNAILCIPIGTLFPLMVNSYFNGGATQAGIIEMMFAVGMLLGSILIGVISNKITKINLIVIALLLFGIPLILSGLLLKNQIFIFGTFTLVMGMCAPLFNSGYFILLQTIIEPSVLGRVISIVTSMMLIATPIGFSLAGPVSEKIGINNWFLISGILTVILAAICRANKNVKSMESDNY